jgi:hypothetical protein
MAKLCPSLGIIRIDFHRAGVSLQGFGRIMQGGQGPKVTGGLSRLLIGRLPFCGFTCHDCLEDRLGSSWVALLQLGKGLFNIRWVMRLTSLLRQSGDGIGQGLNLLLIRRFSCSRVG